MLGAIYRFELSAWMRQPTTFLITTAYLLLPFVLFVGSGGYFDSGAIPENMNSSYRIASMLQSVGRFLLFLIPVFVGGSLHRDFHGNAHVPLYSYPIRSTTYLTAKFASGLTMVMLIATMPLIGFLAGEVLLGITPIANGYVFAYGAVLIPTLAVISLLVFCLVALTRSLYAGFVLILFVLMMQPVIDPLGELAALEHTREWTLWQKENDSLRITEGLVIHRAIWMGIAAIVAGFTLSVFSMHQFGWRIRSPWMIGNRPRSPLERTPMPPVIDLHIDTGRWQQCRQWIMLIRHQTGHLLSHWVFLSFCGIGLALMWVLLNRVLVTNEVVMLPLTRILLQVPAYFYTHHVAFATFVFAGMLVLRARESQMDAIIESTPMPTWVWTGSVVTSLVLIQSLLLGLFMAIGITLQGMHGQVDVDVATSATTLFLFHLPGLAVWACLAVAVFNLTKHLYLGLFLLLLAWLAQFGYETLGISTRLLQFNTYPMLELSDMNGFGHIAPGRWLLHAYWLGWVSVLFLPLGRRRKPNAFVVGVLVVSLAVLAWVVRNEESKIIAFDESVIPVERMGDRPHLRIRSITLRLDLHPDKRSFEASGHYQMVNESDQAIDTVYVRTSVDEFTALAFERAARLVDSIPAMGIEIHALGNSIAPGDTLRLAFTIRNRPNSLFQRNSNVLENGTFLTQDILPRTHESTGSKDRMRMDVTVSTSSDQRPLANGTLVREWTEDGRNVARFVSSQPVKFNLVMASGRYDTHTDQWNGIPITVHHHPDHTQNLSEIVDGVKAALDMNGRLFGHMPTEEIRIIEYPLSEGSFSTLKSNTLVMSESVFGVDSKQEGKIPMPFYIAAHEMTHHWFGNELIPASGKGAVFVSESLTEYLTLSILRRWKGDDIAQAFLKAQQDRYVRGRANATRAEPPLILVEAADEYVAYGKGAVVLDSIAQQLGRPEFDRVLRRFFEQYRGIGASPTSMDFASMLLREAPASQKRTIERQLGL